jgi:uncharacterized membrane protein YeaQ/YmgE (transglycosylase-associated protein family)
LLLLLVAGICGALGQAITGYSRGGCLVSVAVGLVGAVIGTWLASQFGLPEILSINVGGTAFPIVWAILGSVLFVGVLSLFHRR